MAEVVFVLGAGASADCGAPLMANFLDVAEDLWLTGVGDAHFERVFRSLAALKSVHAQSNLDTYNLEAVFSAFEMGAMVGRLGSITDAGEIEATRTAMVRLVACTLQETVGLPVDGSRVLPPPSYAHFVTLLRHRSTPTASAPAVITLNYDLALDYALHHGSIPYAYGVTDDAVPPQFVKLLKLHGSLNWGFCEQCKQLVPWRLEEYFQKFRWDLGFPLEPNEKRSVKLAVADHIGQKVCSCGQHLRSEPVVVPPTWNKGDNRVLRSVWRHAARELAEARYLVFIGYSFPETDLYFRYLLALGLAGDSRIRRIGVVDPSSTAQERLLGMLNQTLRPRVVHVAEPLRNVVTDLRRLLALP